MFCCVGGPADGKLESWSWSQYLEEQKAVAAPAHLFQEVCFFLNRSIIIEATRNLYVCNVSTVYILMLLVFGIQ